ncbi:MAG: restriction endonuclease [Lachnospiraceae bacterium]|nr:restriction endonuclease [Lachnospiraceae bacterium]
MSKEIVSKAIEAAVASELSFCKFLAANDTGATGGHQSGVLVSVSASRMMFKESLPDNDILKRNVKITWQGNLTTESAFTYYSSKRELRITKFGRGFDVIYPDRTGALFVLTKQSWDDYSAYILDTEDEIEEFLNTFGISATETNCLFGAGGVQRSAVEKQAIETFISSLQVEFPETEAMSLAARAISETVYNHVEYLITNPDKKIIEWTNMEYALFRAIEEYRYGDIVKTGFTSVEEFVSVANSILNRRKSRAGKSLEHHLEAIFNANQIVYDSQAVTEGKKKPDFLFPSAEAYHDISYPLGKLATLAAKTTCKDRWRQILNEADRLKDENKFLCTLQQGVSPAQMDEMGAEKVILVVPKPYISCYPKDRQDRIWTISRFVEYIKRIQDDL